MNSVVRSFDVVDVISRLKKSFERAALTAVVLVLVIPASGAFGASKPHSARKQAAPEAPKEPSAEEVAAKQAADAAAAQAAAELAAEKERAEARLTTLETKLQASHQQLDSLKAQLAQESSQRSQADSDLKNATANAIKDLPPTLRVSGIGVQMSGFVQVEAVTRQSSSDEINSSTGDLLNQDRVMLRRARLRFEVDRGYVAGALELDANTVSGPQVRPIDAEASLKWPSQGAPLVMATVGLFKTPFGYELLQSDRDRLFIDRSAAERAMFPGEYDVGARLAGSWRFLRYAVAAMNGEPVGERTLPGRDPNAAKDFVGRLGVETNPTESLTAWFGFSLLKGKGFRRGTPATKDVLQWRDLNDNRSVDIGEINVIPGSGATNSFNFDRHVFGADLGTHIRWSEFVKTSLYGEVYVGENMDRGILPYEPVSPDSPATRELGYYAAIVQSVSRHFMLGARYDVYNPDRDASDSRVGSLFARDRSFSTLALTAGLVGPFGRLVLEWDDNKNHQGRNIRGEPTNLKDNAIWLRGQVHL